jgi:hypothetical protein
MMFIDNPGWADDDLPIGLVKTSDDGREPGEMGIRHFVNAKRVRISAAGAPSIRQAAAQSPGKNGEAA